MLALSTSSLAADRMGPSDYRIRLNAEIDLDLPNGFQNLSKYCATLGHKANHSFLPNVEWVIVEHPRYGLIRGLKTLDNIEQDDEILVNYSMNLADAPEWYRIVWLKHQREYKKASDASIKRILDRYYENSGKRFPMPASEELVVPEPQGVDDLDLFEDGEFAEGTALIPFVEKGEIKEKKVEEIDEDMMPPSETEVEIMKKLLKIKK